MQSLLAPVNLLGFFSHHLAGLAARFLRRLVVARLDYIQALVHDLGLGARCGSRLLCLQAGSRQLADLGRPRSAIAVGLAMV